MSRSDERVRGGAYARRSARLSLPMRIGERPSASGQEAFSSPGGHVANLGRLAGADGMARCPADVGLARAKVHFRIRTRCRVMRPAARLLRCRVSRSMVVNVLNNLSYFCTVFASV
ncbi:jg10457 [Pararge aegeria aegeria]|uniref:Jg10457 protein n=1 Tax=Pararge aegeria aegeria TaxID=348720 RepID=A0A8S4REA1_9NEOP|nr:jg10457 [Pararge aegeria aegeria]